VADEFITVGRGGVAQAGRQLAYGVLVLGAPQGSVVVSNSPTRRTVVVVLVVSGREGSEGTDVLPRRQTCARTGTAASLTSAWT
jgi:hypothetical protein